MKTPPRAPVVCSCLCQPPDAQGAEGVNAARRSRRTVVTVKEHTGNHKAPTKVVLVTGSSSGIGLAAAEALHAAGWTVIGSSRRSLEGLAWRHEAVDVTDQPAVVALVTRVLQRYGRLDAVVCCAGWGVAGPVETTPSHTARAQFDTNYWGTVYVVQASLEHLRASKGRIVVTSSVAGGIGIPFQAAYAASKFALEGWAESLAWEVEPHGVRVTLVQPGNFRTGFSDARIVGDPGPYGDAAGRAITSMERDERNGAEPERVAGCILSVLARRRPPLRVSVGSPPERAGVWMKRLLPFRVFQWIAAGSLRG